MILILGSVYDDVLYFDTQLKKRREETFKDHFKIIFGELYGQNVVLAYNIFTNYMSSVVTTYLISKYDVIAVINVGSVRCLDDFKEGDIVYSETLFLGDADVSVFEKVKKGQVPTYPQIFSGNSYFNNLINVYSSKFIISNVKKGNYISLNREIVSIDQLNQIKNENVILGVSKDFIFDSTFGGVALSSATFDVPFVCLKVVISKIKDKVTTLERIRCIKEYANVGKIISAIILEIGRKDTLTVDTLN
ncbi:MAG: hypothetical protein SPI36_02785 [Candidatus Onthovivens sp.]|nr:hypothetical protein [Mollicutes bacterium]MDD6468499.1 hypothetical protein [Bacilli bacterium]MDY2724805.1 hypothetical protein [Candidatus Onthovivens sp.]MCI6614623.1 hypothetical protein [Mollicutes bacterium]MCI7040410.1 hypothetical protein [Mollicutes bacterium]